MKDNFRAHPIMIISFLKPFLFVLILPIIKGGVQYLLYRRISGIVSLEAAAFAVIFTIAVLRWRMFSVETDGSRLTIKAGILFKSFSVIDLSRLSSVSSSKNPIDAIFRSVTYRINTEAGRKGKPDFEFKLKDADGEKLSHLIYGIENRTAIRFSPIKIALMSAATSSAITGIIIGAPIINKIGNLLGIAISDMLFDEINTVSESVNTYFPPIVNTVTIVIVSAYALAFLISFLRYVTFRLFIGNEKIEISSGIFVRRRSVFKKKSINDVCIEQTPLMRLFRMFSLSATVGGYGDSRGEKAIIAPSGKRYEIMNQFRVYFPFLLGDGAALRATRSRRNKRRFLWIARLYALIALGITATAMIIFPYFDRLILFVGIIAFAIIEYYASLCIYNYRYGRISFGDSVFAKGSYGFNFRELYCEKENIAFIKLIETPADRSFGTCKVSLTVRSESADSIRVRNLDRKMTVETIEKCFGISGINR